MASSGSVSPSGSAEYKALEDRIAALERKIGVTPPAPPQHLPVQAKPGPFAGPNRRVKAGVSPTGVERRH
jgi:hypothetical protein